MDNFVTILGYILTPLAAVVTWFASRKKQRNDFLKDLQASIDLLSKKNKDLLDEVINLRSEVVQLKSENKQLRVEVEELNRRLENVKTITRYKNE
jgi:regulator of replication initiation timing